MGDRLGFLEVEFQGMEPLEVAPLQGSRDAGCLGGTDGIDKQRCPGAMVNKVEQRFHWDVGVGDHGSRVIDYLNAGFQKFGRDVRDDVGVGHSGYHVASLVIDTQVQAITLTFKPIAQGQIQPDGLAFPPAHLAKGFSTE